MVALVITKKNGFTLVEVLISILLLTVVILGILQTMAVYERINIDNTIRDEATKIAQECLEDLRNGVNCENNVIRKFRNFSISFVISSPDVTNFNSKTTNPVSIVVSYKYPSSNKNQSITLNTVIYKP